MRPILVVLATMRPELYEQAKHHLLNMSYADYYLTAYPTYDGYKIELDPTLTAYCHLTTTEPQPEEPAPVGTGILVIIAIIAVELIATTIIILKKRH